MQSYHKSDFINTVKLLCCDIFKNLTNEDIISVLPKLNIDENFLILKKPTIFERAINKFIFQKKTNIYKRVLFKILELRKKLKQVFDVSVNGEIKFLLRVDDFPRHDLPTEKFFRFYEIFEKYQIPFLLGVTPFISKEPMDYKNKEYRKLTDKEFNFLQESTKEVVEVALHGFHHKKIKKNVKSELIGMTEKKLEEKIILSLKELADFDVKVFIPPFNTIDEDSFKVVSKYFVCISAGREAIPYLGFRLTPSYFYNILYIPSYEPAYGYAFEVSEYVDKLLEIKDNIVVPLTLHWSWEVKDDFKYVKVLAEKIEDRVIKWRDFYGSNSVFS